MHLIQNRFDAHVLLPKMANTKMTILTHFTIKICFWNENNAVEKQSIVMTGNSAANHAVIARMMCSITPVYTK